MYSFKNDYSEIAHEKILNRLINEQNQQFDGYSEDEVCEKVKQKIKKELHDEKCDIHFMSGGTQCNLIAISHVLRPYQGVISASSGHIATHETGAIEATGHKVITIPSEDGKLYAEDVKKVLEEYAHDEVFEHVVEPAMVYISNPTELGTIYNKKEIEDLRAVCDKYASILYMDGARLASALSATSNDIELKDLANLCDMFYIGGTKCGAMYGESLVICRERHQKSFRNYMKQKGALLSKGYNIGLQFDELFTDDLYFKIGRHQNELASYLAEELKALDVDFLQNQITNQVFPIFNNDIIENLEKKYAFHRWGKIDKENSAIRLCMSFKTSREKIDEFLADVKLHI